MAALHQELHMKMIIENLDEQRPGTRLRIHLNDLLIAVPANFIELRMALCQKDAQLIDKKLMNAWLDDSGYRLNTAEVNHDADGSWAIIEKIK